MSDITPLDVARKAIELCEANPDFVYEAPQDVLGAACAYVHPTEDGFDKGCLFGQALIALGVPAEDLLEVNTWGIAGLLDKLGIAPRNIDHPFAYVQGAQDAGSSWGSDDVQGALERYVRARS